MNLPAFLPKPWVVDVYRSQHDPGQESRPSRRNPRELLETFDLLTEAEAQELAARKCHAYDSVTYEGVARPANARDFARQRLEQIAEALAQDLESTLRSEESILAYDTYLLGEMDFKGPILEAVQDALDNLTPEDQDPVQMGWVSSRGVP